ncbi:FYN-binding protein 2 isoform X6 [Anolis carolinensis]|uniref:FYN-binding protein 2 isoform X6 n=1 Tax=Anolis carolinensis TaxID=28377 RepID=UPI002F2B59CE
MDMVMNMERTEDFKALRAKFQNDSNFSNTLLTPAKKPPVVTRPQSSDGNSLPHPKPKPLSHIQVPEIIPRQNSNGNSTSCPKPLGQVQFAVPEQKTEKFSYISHPSEITPVKPRALPRVRLRDLSEVEKNNDRKDSDFPGTLGKRPIPGADLQKQRPASFVHPEEILSGKPTFQNTRKLWESASSLNSDQKSSTAPPQYPNRTTSLGYLKTANDVTDVPKDKDKSVENEQAPKNPSQCEATQFLIVSPPVPPRNHMTVDKVACEAVKPIDSSTNTNDLNKASMTLHCSNEAVDDAYMTPEITEIEELSTYEETLSCLVHPECSNSIHEAKHIPKAGKKEDAKKQNFLVAIPSSEIKDSKERGPLWNHDAPKQQAKETSKVSDRNAVLTNMKMNGENRGEKHVTQEETIQPSPGKRLTVDGNFSDGYVCLENLIVDEEKASTTAPTSMQTVEEVYDDVEGLQSDLQACDAYSSFTSDTFADENNEETYEDVQTEEYNSTKSEDGKVEKLKGLGKFFKKGKFKVRNANMKENFRNLSRSAPNLDVIAQETMVYNNVDTEQTDANSSPRNFFKIKKYNLEKNNKMSKEEKLFREKFMYDKEITVINTAVAHCSNASTKGKRDLKITAGEQLEVIDVTEGNQLICRNSEGKYGYVLLEHLNFRH